MDSFILISLFSVFSAIKLAGDKKDSHKGAEICPLHFFKKTDHHCSKKQISLSIMSRLIRDEEKFTSYEEVADYLLEA